VSAVLGAFVAQPLCGFAQTGNKSGSEIPGWGTTVSPKGDCELTSSAGTLSIMVPGTYHDLHTSSKLVSLDAPRVLQPVDHDFTVQVRVRRFPIPPAMSAANPENPYSFVSSGLVIWKDPQHFIRFQRAANGDSRRVSVMVQVFSGAEMAGWSRVEIPDEDIWLRVERQAGRFTFQHSLDGQAWTRLEPNGGEWKTEERVEAGVFSINATTRAITHEFTDLRVTGKAPPAEARPKIPGSAGAGFSPRP
jgi:regulation of enolase protein 1 (concanavalin A-like superfamily)